MSHAGVSFRPRLECLEDRITPISGIPTTTALLVAPDPAQLGQTVTLTADVSASGNFSPLGGTVEFFDGGTLLGTAALSPPPGAGPGTAQFTTTTLGAGSHVLTARYDGLVFLSSDWMASSSAPVLGIVGTADVTALVRVKRGPLLPDPLTGHLHQTVTLRDVGGMVVPGPLYLVLDGLPGGVHLRRPSGFTQVPAPLGDPFRTVFVSQLVPGRAVHLTLEFSATRHAHVRYNSEVLAGLGPV